MRCSMLSNLQPIKESYEFVITFKGEIIHVFIIHDMDEENFHDSSTETYYIDTNKDKKILYHRRRA